MLPLAAACTSAHWSFDAHPSTTFLKLSSQSKGKALLPAKACFHTQLVDHLLISKAPAASTQLHAPPHATSPSCSRLCAQQSKLVGPSSNNPPVVSGVVRGPLGTLGAPVSSSLGRCAQRAAHEFLLQPFCLLETSHCQESKQPCSCASEVLCHCHRHGCTWGPRLPRRCTD